MPATSSCTPCCDTTLVTAQVPGPTGQSAYTETVGAITIPGAAGAAGTIEVGNSDWIAVHQILFISDETNYGHFEVTSIPDSTHIAISWLDYNGDNGAGLTIAIGAKVAAAGPTLTTPISLANGGFGASNADEGAARSVLLETALDAEATFTDNSTGAATNTIAAGAGKFTLSVYFRANAITGNVLLYTYTPGFAFKIIRISAAVCDAITTGAKAATLTTAIAGAPTTGGIVIMSGTYALGAEQASSAAITAAQSGSSAQAITITASAVTQFSEGGFMLNLEIQNMDTANAIASLAAKQNTVLTALKP